MTVKYVAPARLGYQVGRPISWEPSLAFLKYAIAANLVGAVIFLIVARFVMPDQPDHMVGPVLMTLVAISAWYVLARGRMQAAVNVIAIGAWMVVTAMSAVNGGVRTPIIVAYPLIILMIGWLISPRAALAVAALTMAAIIGFVMFDASGLLPYAPPSPPALHGVVQVILVALATLLIIFLVRAYQNRLNELGQIGSALARRTLDLETSKAELNRAQAVAKVGSWVYDIVNDQMRLSPETCRIFALPEGTTGSREAYLTRTHAQDRSAVDRAWQAALQGAVFDQEHRIMAGKAVRWIRQKAELEFAGDGTALSAVGITQDITERKQAELAMQESEERYRALIEWTPDAIIVHRLGDIIYVNPAAVKLFGAASAQDLVGRLTRDLVHPDFLEVQMARMQSIVDNVPIAPMVESRFLQLDGTAIDVEVQGTAIVYDGAPAIHVSVRNITARKQADKKLYLAANVFIHAREGIMVTTADGTIVDVNAAFSRITGYSRDEALGQNPRLLSSGRHEKSFYATLWRSLFENDHWYGEIWNRRKNGEVYAEMLNISAVRDAQGKAEHFMALFSDITALKEHERQLEHIAHYDALTSLPNRVLLADRLRHGMAQAQRRGQLLAVAFLDLDGFKAINDRHGHEAGDQFLIAVASRMKLALRDGDTLARMGGDEFVAVLVDLADAAASEPMLTRLLAAAAQPVRISDHTLQVSASLGVTFFPQSEDVDADQLLRQADQAMYQAKVAGKNRYHVFDAEQDRSVRGHHESLEDIRRALDQREFVLYYQPKVNMRSGKVVGAEALIRWQHPERGLLVPAMFLSVIEDHALAVELGEWVINTALTQIALWHAAGLNIPVSVNVGARQLQQTNFVERLRALLAAHPDVKPGALALEVLETSALEELAHVSQIIVDCRQIGVMFALDDFGTGYSSLTYLKRLSVSQLKIDQSFVRDMLDDPDDLAILQGVLGLAAAFRRQVIAEGVETVQHGSMLLQLGCELAQGYGIAGPMPAADLPGWVATWRPDPSWMNLRSVSRDELPLLYAAVEHRAWILAMENHLKGERETPPQLDPHQCRFGKWLDGEGLARHGTQPAFGSVATLHHQAHRLAAELCELQARGPQAMDRLGELHGLQHDLLEQLKALA